MSIPPQNSPPPHVTEIAPIRAIRSDDILQGQKEVRILHEGEVYRLLVTRNGKLILQK